MRRVIIVSSDNKPEGALVCDDDQVDHILEQFNAANLEANTPVEITVVPLEGVNLLLDYIRSC